MEIFENQKPLSFDFDESLDKIKKLDDRSLMIYHKSLKRKSTVKRRININGGKAFTQIH